MVLNSNSTKVYFYFILMNNFCILVFWLSGFDLILYISHFVYGHFKSYFSRRSSVNNISLIKVKLNLGNEVL